MENQIENLIENFEEKAIWQNLVYNAQKKNLNKNKKSTFQDIIFNLQKFWAKNGCIILQPYDLEVGAGTFHPATTLRSLGQSPGEQSIPTV